MTAKHVTHWIGGKPWTGTAQRQGDLYDPATGQVTGVVDFASQADVAQAETVLETKESVSAVVAGMMVWRVEWGFFEEVVDQAAWISRQLHKLAKRGLSSQKVQCGIT